MKKIIINILIIAALFIIIDRLISHFVYYVASKNIYDKRIGNILRNNLGRKDVLLFGSSRTARDLMANEIEKASGLTVYNLGYPGSNIDFHLELLKLVVDAGLTPKVAILAVDDRVELMESDTINFRVDTLKPYSNYDNIRNILYSHGDTSAQISKYIYTYTLGNNLSIMFPNKHPGKLDIIQPDGSMPLTGRSSSSKDMVFNNITTYDINNESPKLAQKFTEFINTCKLNSIQLIILFPPNFGKPSNKFIHRMKLIINNKACLVDYSTFITSNESFYDGSHLNQNGAMIFSSKVGELIKNCQISRK
jgi:hypothetical protein